MGNIIDFNEKKQEKERIDELCDLVEQASKVPYSDSWEFQKRLREKQWEDIVERYNGASALDIFCDMMEGFSADRIDEVYLAFDNLFLQYIQSIVNVAVADPPEYEEYAKTDIKTIPTYLHFAQVGAKKLKEIIPGGDKPEVLQGYLVFETMMLDYLYDAIKKEQV